METMRVIAGILRCVLQFFYKSAILEIETFGKYMVGRSKNGNAEYYCDENILSLADMSVIRDCLTPGDHEKSLWKVC